MGSPMMRYCSLGAFFFVIWTVLMAGLLILFFGTLLLEIVEKW